jgi:hypothetical protein
MKSIVLGLSILLASNAFAASETSLKKLDVNKKVTSSDIRKEKSFSVVAGFGINLSEGSQSVGVEYFLESDALLAFRGSYSDDTSGTNEYKDRQISFEIAYKKFVSNSFYLRPGVYYRDYKEENVYESFWSDQTERYKDLGMAFAIGNQWQFNKLTIGCDWFGLANSFKTFKNTTPYQIRELSVSLLNFYMGMSF